MTRIWLSITKELECIKGQTKDFHQKELWRNSPSPHHRLKSVVQGLQRGLQGLQRGPQGPLTGPDLPENRDLVQGPETVIPGKAETAETTNVPDPAVEIANVKGQDHVTGRHGEEGLRGHPAEAVQVADDLGRSRGHPGGHQLA